MMEVYLLVLFIAFAALIAALVDMYDVPVTKAAILPFVKTFIGCLIAAIVVTWALESSGELEFAFVPWATVAGTSVGGLALVRGMLAGYARFKAESG